ncbi:MAG TPA: hypothetical protein DCE23_04280 [Firmicutes bacterium]|nr:hypothetical protein [Bacillota bacterium]
MKEFIEKDIKENGIENLKEALKEGINPDQIKLAEERYKNYTKEYRDFKIKISQILTKIKLMSIVLQTEAIYDKKADLIELGTLLINEGNKIIELGMGVNK